MAEPSDDKTNIEEIKIDVAYDLLCMSTALFLKQVSLPTAFVAAGAAREQLDGVATSRGVPSWAASITPMPFLNEKDFWSALDGPYGALRFMFGQTKDDKAAVDLLADLSWSGLYPRLFSDWYDYILLKRSFPLEIFVFMQWVFEMEGVRLMTGGNQSVMAMFPYLRLTPSFSEQHKRLLTLIEQWRGDPALSAFPFIDPRPLPI